MKRSLSFHVGVVATVLLASSLTSRAARADDKAACVAAYEQTQELRRQNKLRAAREQLVVCTRDACPKLVRGDCTKWMEEVTASIPSLVFAARDASGRDRSDVKVLIDGVPVESELGQVVPVDPGVHKIRFEAKDAEPQEQEVVVRAGEKNRLVTVTIDRASKAAAAAPPPDAPAPARSPSPSPSSASTARGDRPVPAIVPILGGLGLVSVGVGGYLALSASSQLDDLRSKCAPACNPSDVDAVNLRYGVAAGAIGVGVLSLGAATWLFLSRPTASDHRVGLSVSPRGVSLGGTF